MWQFKYPPTNLHDIHFSQQPYLTNANTNQPQTTTTYPSYPISHLSLSVTYPLPHHITPPRLASPQIPPTSSTTSSLSPSLPLYLPHPVQLVLVPHPPFASRHVTSRPIGTPGLGIRVKHWLTCHEAAGPTLRTVGTWTRLGRGRFFFCCRCTWAVCVCRVGQWEVQEVPVRFRGQEDGGGVW
jgi:hypothetical protein